MYPMMKGNFMLFINMYDFMSFFVMFLPDKHFSHRLMLLKKKIPYPLSKQRIRLWFVDYFIFTVLVRAVRFCLSFCTSKQKGQPSCSFNGGYPKTLFQHSLDLLAK